MRSCEQIKVVYSGMMNSFYTPLPLPLPLKGQAKVKYNYNVAGYYFHNSWRPLSGAIIQQFNDSSSITRCLRGKVMYMFGDSTVRQWFEYLTAFVPGKSRFINY